MTKSALTVAILGLGYIGLPTAAIAARAGCHVVGIDIAQHVVDTINRGEIHLEEKDLDALVRGVVERGLLRASTVVELADVFVIAVPTPTNAAKVPDLGLVRAAVTAIAPVLRPGNLVILESTSPIGTTEDMRDVLAGLRPDLAFPGEAAGDIAMAYCPERVLPGHILTELVANARLIGGVSLECAARAREFYELFVEGECVICSCREAEMAKLVENAYRDVNIAFANELSLISDRLDLDVWNVIRLANRHPRVNILQPGPGVGGHCISVDPWFLVHSAPEQTPLIRTAREVNDGKVDHVVRRVEQLAAKREGPIALFGLAFKPDIDDFRESPALRVAERIAEAHPDRVLVCEPFAAALPPSLIGKGVELVEPDAALARAAIAVLLVDHSVFRSVSRTALDDKLIYDTRGVWPAPKVT